MLQQAASQLRPHQPLHVQRFQQGHAMPPALLQLLLLLLLLQRRRRRRL
jgi:MYXO-CTERM domain-containing protein